MFWKRTNWCDHWKRRGLIFITVGHRKRMWNTIVYRVAVCARAQCYVYGQALRMRSHSGIGIQKLISIVRLGWLWDAIYGPSCHLQSILGLPPLIAIALSGKLGFNTFTFSSTFVFVYVWSWNVDYYTKHTLLWDNTNCIFNI